WTGSALVVEAELGERRPPGIGRALAGLVGVAVSRLAGADGHDLGCRALAVVAAERRERQGEEERLPGDLGEVDLLADDRPDLLVDRVTGEQLVDLGVELAVELGEAAAALPHPRRSDPTGDGEGAGVGGGLDEQ